MSIGKIQKERRISERLAKNKYLINISKVKKENSISLTFTVNQIGETEKYLRSKDVRIIMQPRTVKDGKKILTAIDPNGIEIDFIEAK